MVTPEVVGHMDNHMDPVCSLPSVTALTKRKEWM